jgi:hypothetical protein
MDANACHAVSQKLRDLRTWIQELRPALQTEGLGCAWNADMDQFCDVEATVEFDIQWIVVGDNPGEGEQETQRYFSPAGGVGPIARLVLERIGYYRSQVLVLNKTPISTAGSEATEKLSPSQRVYLESTQDRMADTICDLVTLTNARTWVMGHGGCWTPQQKWRLHPIERSEPPRYPKGILYPIFFRKLAAFYAQWPTLASCFYISKHFSNANFFGEVDVDHLIHVGVEQALIDLEAKQNYRADLLVHGCQQP